MGLLVLVPPLISIKTHFHVLEKGGEVVLVDRHTYRNGSVSVYSSSESFFVDSECNRDSLLAALERASYNRVDIVSSPGEFASRGSVVDFFPKERPFPVRVDFSFEEADLIFV